MAADLAIPILPARDLAVTVETYGAMGFTVGHQEPDYLILRHGPVELHFFRSPHQDPATNDHGAYVRVADADAWFDVVRPAEPRLRRLVPAENKPWGMREFAVIDADGNLLRIGQPLA